MSYSANPPGGSVGQKLELALFWAFVGIPLLWGVSETIANATKLFR